MRKCCSAVLASGLSVACVSNLCSAPVSAFFESVDVDRFAKKFGAGALACLFFGLVSAFLEYEEIKVPFSGKLSESQRTFLGALLISAGCALL